MSRPSRRLTRSRPRLLPRTLVAGLALAAGLSLGAATSVDAAAVGGLRSLATPTLPVPTPTMPLPTPTLPLPTPTLPLPTPTLPLPTPTLPLPTPTLPAPSSPAGGSPSPGCAVGCSPAPVAGRTPAAGALGASLPPLRPSGSADSFARIAAAASTTVTSPGTSADLATLPPPLVEPLTPLAGISFAHAPYLWPLFLLLDVLTALVVVLVVRRTRSSTPPAD